MVFHISSCSTERERKFPIWKWSFNLVRAISGDIADGLRRVEDNVTQEFSSSALEDR